MNDDISLTALVAELESRVAHHRERRDLHAREEASHRQHREAHEAELEALSRSLEAYKSAAAAVVELARRPGPAPAPASSPDTDAGPRLTLARMVTRVVESWPAGQPFGGTAVAQEVTRRYGERFRKPADPRLVSFKLRRLSHEGQIAMVSKGRPFHEALYVRQG